MRGSDIVSRELLRMLGWGAIQKGVVSFGRRVKTRRQIYSHVESVYNLTLIQFSIRHEILSLGSA
jgi:hypothetical protein